MEQRDISWYAT